MVIVGIKHLDNISGKVLLLHRLTVITLVKGIQLEYLHGLSIPDTKGIHDAVAVSHDGKIKGNGSHCLVILLHEARITILIRIHGHMSAKLHHLCILRSAKLERIAVLQPVVGYFYLITVLDGLLEHTIAIADTASVCRVAQSSQGIQEACCQSAQTTVAQCCIRLLILHQIQIKSQLVQCLANGLGSLQVNNIIAKSTTHQKLHGHVVNHLGILLLIGLLGLDPVIHDLILDCKGCSLKYLLRSSLLHVLAVQSSHIIDYTSLEKILVKLQIALF